MQYSNLSNTYFNECECICGNKKSVRYWHLTHSKTKSCGCVYNEGWFKGKAVGDLSSSYLTSFRYGRVSKGIPFSEDITLEFLWNLFLKQDKKCAISGIQIYLNKNWSKQNKGKKTKVIQTASLDRIDSNKGYTKDNVQWVHKTINLMKGQLTDLEFITVCKIVSENKNIEIDKTMIKNIKWRPKTTLNNEREL